VSKITANAAQFSKVHFASAEAPSCASTNKNCI